MNCENKPSCIKEGESCMLRIPHNNLHDNNLINDILYLQFYGVTSSVTKSNCCSRLAFALLAPPPLVFGNSS